MPAAKKKQKRINKAPSGISFMYEPRGEDFTKPTPCPDGCGGHIVRVEEDFTCSNCDWLSTKTDTGRQRSKRQKPWQRKPMKKQKPNVDPPELRSAVRKEARKRMKTLIRIRKEIHKPMPKLTQAERDRLHKYGFSIVEIRDEIKEI